jgi:uncharacterized RDD family membrane protein YckC
VQGNDEHADATTALPTRRDPDAGRRPEDVAVGLVVFGARLGVRAGRVAIFPLRVAGRLAGTSRVERGLGAEGSAAAARGRALVEETVDRTLAGPLPDTVAQKLVEHQVVERIVADVLRQMDVDAALTAALADERTHEQFRRALANPEVERLASSAAESRLAAELAERLVANPQVRAALARQTTSAVGELLGKIRGRLARVDDRLSRASGASDVRYGGVATRAVALTVDALLAQLAVFVPAAVIALIASLAGGLGAGWLVDTLLGVGWFFVVAAYFVFFWSTVGETPGMSLMGLRVTDARGETPSALRSTVRFIGLVLSIIPLFAGFLPVLFDARRRSLADYLAGTVVRAES